MDERFEGEPQDGIWFFKQCLLVAATVVVVFLGVVAVLSLELVVS
jgi:hypothetical protein